MARQNDSLIPLRGDPTKRAWLKHRATAILAVIGCTVAPRPLLGQMPSTPAATETNPQSNSSRKSPIHYRLQIQAGTQVNKTTHSGENKVDSAVNPDQQNKQNIKSPEDPVQGYASLKWTASPAAFAEVRLRLLADHPANIVDMAIFQWSFYSSTWLSSQGQGAKNSQKSDQEPSSQSDFTPRVAFGRTQLLLGGFDNQTESSIGMPLSTYLQYRVPFRDQNDRRTVDGVFLGTTTPSFGTFDLQVIKDVKDTTYENSRKSFAHNYVQSKKQGQAVVGQWFENFQLGELALVPLFQGGRYDGFRSQYLGLGLSATYKDFITTADLSHDRRAAKAANSDLDLEQETFASTTLGTFSIAYHLSQWKPFLKLSQFTTVQSEIDVLGNRTLASFDDQCAEGFLGTSLDMQMLGSIKPFGWVQMQRQKVVANPRNPLETSTAVTKSLAMGLTMGL